MLDQDPDKNASDEELCKAYARLRKWFQAGDLYYCERWSNGGGYTIGYDVKEGKAYYDNSRN